jgi:hypothetical protein
VWDGLPLDMLPSAERRWRSLSPDDKVVLAYALKDAIARPDRVGFYKLKFLRVRQTGEIIQLHTFRFGYANFVIATTPTTLIICDFWLDDDSAMAAE